MVLASEWNIVYRKLVSKGLLDDDPLRYFPSHVSVEVLYIAFLRDAGALTERAVACTRWVTDCRKEIRGGTREVGDRDVGVWSCIGAVYSLQNLVGGVNDLICRRE